MRWVKNLCCVSLQVKMRAHFPKLVDVDEWKDSYTGKIHKSGTGERAESLGKTLQSSSSERRSMFLQGGAEKPRRPDTEEMEAEIILPAKTGITASKIMGARQFFGQSSFANQGSNLAQLNTPFPEAPIRNAPVKVESLVNERELKSTGEGLKQSAQLGIGGKVKARDSAPAPSEREAKSAQSIPASQKKSEPSLKPDLLATRSVQSYTPIEVQSKVNMTGSSQVAKDIILDILMDSKRGVASTSKEALQGLQDIALKMVMPTITKAQTTSLHSVSAEAQGFTSRADPSLKTTKITKQLEVRQGARGEHNNLEKEEKFLIDSFRGKKGMELFQKAQSSSRQMNKQETLTADLTMHFLSSDVQKAAVTSLTTNWKEDQDEQLRVGTWAVHVLSGQVNSVPAELLRGMKSDALKALGRLSMQLLASSAASAHSDSQPMLKSDLTSTRSGTQYTGSEMAQELFENAGDEKHDMEIERVVENISHLSKAAIKGSNEFFRMESIQGDLQALQNNIQLDFTADMLVEGFIEALRSDTEESSTEMRSDILSAFHAKQTNSSHVKKNIVQSSRSQQVTFDVESQASAGDKRKKFQVVVEDELPIVVEMGSSVQKSETDSSKHSKDLGFEQGISPETDQGGWLNVPQSKFLD